MTVPSGPAQRFHAYLDNVAYKHRVEFPGYYHVTARGNNKRPIFLDDRDRQLFVLLLNRVATKYGWTIFAFCLMGNHYHLVMRIDDRGMAKGMCELNGKYALLFNLKYARVNHLFGKRYWSDEIQSDDRFRGACRYVVRNPVKAGMVESPDAYVWSSYQATVGIALGRVRVAVDELLSRFGRDRATAIASFRQLCDGPDESSPVRWQPP
jgi:REP element-mobilizing transposase RayT